MLEKIKMIHGMDTEYRQDHVGIVPQKTILGTFEINSGWFKEQIKTTSTRTYDEVVTSLRERLSNS